MEMGTASRREGMTTLQGYQKKLHRARGISAGLMGGEGFVRQKGEKKKTCEAYNSVISKGKLETSLSHTENYKERGAVGASCLCRWQKRMGLDREGFRKQPKESQLYLEGRSLHRAAVVMNT